MKNELSKILDERADQETRECLEGLSISEKEKLWKEISEFRKELKGVTPRIMITSLRRTENVVTWKLSCAYEVHRSTQF